MHIQHDIQNIEVEGKEIPLPVVLYTVPDRFKYKMTEVTFTNLGQTPTRVVLSDVSGANSVEKLVVNLNANETLSLNGFMRHFAKSVVATNLVNDTVVAISSSGYLC